MNYHVVMVEVAERDLYEIHRYIEMHESPERADTLLDDLERVISGLPDMPERGHFPPELERIGIREYREIHCKLYRIVYAIIGDRVIVHTILDGRRDMQALLQQRILR